MSVGGAGIDAALGRLRTDRLDLVHLHSCPLETLVRRGVQGSAGRSGGESVVDALTRSCVAGKVRVAAYSGEGDALAWAVRSGAFGSVQCSVSAVDQAVLAGAVAEAPARGLGVLAKRALGNAPWRCAQRPEEVDVAEAWQRFRTLGFDPGGLPWAELFTRFAAFAPGVSAVLVGTTSDQHLLEAVESVGPGPLPEALAAKLAAGWAGSGQLWSGRI